jgi:hypothetical protein
VRTPSGCDGTRRRDDTPDRVRAMSAQVTLHVRIGSVDTLMTLKVFSRMPHLIRLCRSRDGCPFCLPGRTRIYTPGGQVVAGSNPVSPTIKRPSELALSVFAPLDRFSKTSKIVTDCHKKLIAVTARVRERVSPRRKAGGANLRAASSSASGCACTWVRRVNETSAWPSHATTNAMGTPCKCMSVAHVCRASCSRTFGKSRTSWPPATWWTGSRGGTARQPRYRPHSPGPHRPRPGLAFLRSDVP